MPMPPTPDPDDALVDDTLAALVALGCDRGRALDAMEAALVARGKPFDSPAEWVDAICALIRRTPKAPAEARA